MPTTDVKIDEKIKIKTKEPKRYKVIFVNDDTTPVEWVITLLITFFKHTSATAENLTMTVHTEGSGVAGVYSYEIAEQKSVDAIKESRNNGFPLQIKIEEE